MSSFIEYGIKTQNYSPIINWSFMGAIPSSLTYARASSGTYFGVDGLLKTAANNGPRFEYDPVTHEAKGLLLEAQATNLLYPSEAISGWNNNSSTVTDNAVVSPRGLQDASELAIDGGYSRGRFRSVTVASSSIYALSLWLRILPGANFNSLWFGFDNTASGSGGGAIRLNLSTLVVSYHNGAATIGMDVTNVAVVKIGDWVRVSFNVLTGASQTSSNFIVYTENSSPSPTRSGSFSVWGVQVEAGTFASSYIPTTTAAATRAADSLYTTSIPWFNPAQGAFEIAGTLTNRAATADYLAIFHDGTGNNRIVLFNGLSETAAFQITTGGVAQVAITIPWDSDKFKLAGSFKYNYAQAAYNGVTSSIDTSVSVPTVTTLVFGSSIYERLSAFHLRSFKYWNRALSDTELQRITT